MADADVKSSTTAAAAAGRRVHFAKNVNKKTTPTLATTSGASNDIDKQLYGFHPLRSLRNIFFGYRSKPRPLSGVSTSKARSTENLTAISAHKLDDDDSGVAVASSTSTPPSARERSSVAVTAARDATAFDRRRSMPYNHMLSISADDLLETSEWSRAPSSELRPTTDLPQAADLAKNTTSDEARCSIRIKPTDDVSECIQQTLPVVTVTSSDEQEDFFAEKWTMHAEHKRRRTYSEDGVMCMTTSEPAAGDLDVVDSRYNLDVSVAKNKLAVKQKGKRATAILQQKMAAAEQARHDRDQTLVSADESHSMTTESIVNPGESREAPNERSDVTDGKERIPDGAERELGTQPNGGENTSNRCSVLPGATANQHGATTHPAGQRMGISSEELAGALRRAVASRNQQQQQPVGRPATPPSTAAKPTKTLPSGGERGESPATTRSSASTPKTSDNAPKSSDNGTLGTSTAGATSSRRIDDNAKNGTTENDGMLTNVKRENSSKDDATSVSTEHRPVKQTLSATAAPEAAAVESRAIAGAANRLKARPQTMAPVSGPSEPAWMVELAARKKQRDHSEATNL